MNWTIIFVTAIAVGVLAASKAEAPVEHARVCDVPEEIVLVCEERYRAARTALLCTDRDGHEFFMYRPEEGV